MAERSSAKGKKHKYCGKCIFCTSKCLECESMEVDVTYHLELRYTNDTEDEIYLETEGFFLTLECMSCGAEFHMDELLSLESALAGLFPNLVTYEDGEVVPKWVTIEVVNKECQQKEMNR